MASVADEPPKDSAQSHTPRTPPLSAALGAFVASSDTDPNSQPAAADDAALIDDGGLDLTLMKKKKKKVKKVEEGDEDTAAADDGGLDLTMKKKKKKPKKTEDGDEDVSDKLKKLDVEDGEDADGAAATEQDAGDMNEGTGIWSHDETKNIGYSLLLLRFFSQLSQKNPDHALSGTKSYKIPPPQCMREGNRKTVFANIADICKRMKRTEEHVTAYLFAELGTNGSVDGSRRLVIKGRFQQKQIENVVRKYISKATSHPVTNAFFSVEVRQKTDHPARSRVRHLQDLQVPRHRAQQGREPSVLHHLQQLRLATQCHRHQDRFLRPGRQEEEDAGLNSTVEKRWGTGRGVWKIGTGTIRSLRKMVLPWCGSWHASFMAFCGQDQGVPPRAASV